MKTIIIFIVSAFAFVRCTYNSEKDNNAKQIDNSVDSIVIIFADPPANQKLQLLPNGPYTPAKDYKISYYDDNFIRQFIEPQYGEKYDTIAIDTKRGILEIVHNYQNIDNIHLYLQKGDTLLIEYKDGKPMSRVLNRTCLPYDFSYDLRKSEHIYQDSFSSLTKLESMPVFFTPSESGNRSFFDQVKQYAEELTIESRNELDLERKFLDSLFNSSLISIEPYIYYKNNIEYYSKIVEYDQSHELTQPENDISFRQYDTTWLGMNVFRQALDKFINSVYVKRVPAQKQSNGSTPDFRIVYDSIAKSDLIDGAAKKYALFNCVQRIIENFPLADGKRYLSLFESQFADSALVCYINEKYKYATTAENELLLKNGYGETLTFKEILEENAGKVVYVDFWASWCAPCMKAIPSSKALHSEFKDVTFIYLSIDDTLEKWQQSSKKHDLEDTKNSFLIENRYTSAYLESMELSSIPRYLIFDKQGNLVHHNAPGPDSLEIRRLFDQYLGN
jgi:thiol-disulfide isomerase/thioredoxin